MEVRQMLRAGAAQVEITPEPGVWLTGYANRVRPATGTHDPLWARALFLESEGKRAALAAADIIGFDDELVTNVRQRVARMVDIPPSHVMLAATHTHSAPNIRCLERMAPVDPAAIERLAEGLTGAIVGAARSAEDAVIGAGFATGTIGANRRRRTPQGAIVMEPNPDGPVDRRVGVLRVEGKRGTICVMLNHACHGVVLGPDNLLYSADWPGAAARAAQAATGGAVTMVTNGACGDINPVERGGFDAVERQGATVARIGLGIFDQLQLSSQVEIEAASRRVSLPTRALSLEQATQVLERSRADLAAARESGEPAAIRVCEIMHPWAQEMADLAVAGTSPEPVIAEVQAITVDDIALLGLPGEAFVEIGTNIACASPFRHTFIIGYANRLAGYLPTRRAFEEGGYEVEVAPRLYGLAPFTPEVQELIEGASLALLKSLR
jgi:hypothetical protein